MNIFVAKLSTKTNEDDLRELFGEFGNVTSAKVIIDRDTGASKGYGFVEMDNDEEANEAINELNDREVDGRQIVVKKARPKSNDSRNRFQQKRSY